MSAHIKCLQIVGDVDELQEVDESTKNKDPSGGRQITLTSFKQIQNGEKPQVNVATGKWLALCNHLQIIAALCVGAIIGAFVYNMVMSHFY